MRYPALLLFAFLGCFSALAQVRPDTAYAQNWRPQVHFSAKKNWLNDPNGLIFFGGEYHLFYQHNPQGIRWGHMTWGHAVSPDLHHWQELPFAISEQSAPNNPADTIMAFSGSCVIDTGNTAGFGKNAMVAIYTGHRKGNQSQYMAYSLDRGRTFTPYANNPVLDRNVADFRDPSVFWHPGVGRWVMVVVLPADQKALIYHSENLKNWVEVSSFQVRNLALGIWECPALVAVPMVANAAPSKWVWLQSVGSGAVAGGSGMQYFVGDFDGTHFLPQDTLTRWLDYGPDYYAAIPVANAPTPVSIGWMNNWTYAQDIPTTPFRSAMSFPRSLRILKTANGYALSQQPAGIQTLYTDSGVIFNPKQKPNATFSRYVGALARAPFEVLINAKPGASFTLRLGYGQANELLIGFDAARQEVFIDRSRAGIQVPGKGFSARSTAPFSGNQTLRLVLDRSSVELFTADGLVTITSQFFPTGPVRTCVPTGNVMRLQVRRLRSTWPVGSR